MHQKVQERILLREVNMDLKEWLTIFPARVKTMVFSYCNHSSYSYGPLCTSSVRNSGWNPQSSLYAKYLSKHVFSHEATYNPIYVWKSISKRSLSDQYDQDDGYSKNLNVSVYICPLSRTAANIQQIPLSKFRPFIIYNLLFFKGSVCVCVCVCVCVAGANDW